MIPNSPEFAALSIEEQRKILDARAIATLTVHHLRCICKDEEPKPWWYHTAEEALKLWQDDTHLARCYNPNPITYEERLQ